ncbi:MAG: type II secretion system secretin GspD [Candidatus Coatesbacteria bacterium]|nr:type II secretion system secretin GspD [Candidatus Coatesbacteria bacterium]
MSNKPIPPLYQRPSTISLCLVLILALSVFLLSGCSVVFKQEDFSSSPATKPGMDSGERAGDTAQDSEPADDAGTSSDGTGRTSEPGASASTISSQDADLEGDAEEDETEEKEVAPDKLLFTTQTKTPTGTLPDDLEEREPWPHLTLEGAPIEEVLEMFIKIMPERGTFNYIVDPSVKTKKITTRFWRPVRPDNLWFILQSILTMNGLAMVDSGRDFYKIVPLPNARQLPIDTYIGRSGDNLELEDSLVTQVIPTEHIAPSELLKLVKPFLSSVSFELANDDTMLLIITDLASNIKRVMTFVQLLDVPTATEELEVYVIRYADASEVASILDKLFSSKKSTTTSSSTRRSSSSRRSSRSRTTTPSTSSDTLGGLGEKPVIITDKRSNSLIVLGRKAAHEAIKTVIEMLDVDVYGAEKTYVYYLENAEAKAMATLLTSLYSKGKNKSTGSRATSTSTSSSSSPFGGKVRESGSEGKSFDSGTIVGDVNIVADEHTNSVIIVTDPINWPEILRTIKSLDIRPKQVLIEVLIAELTLDKTTQFGLEWALKGEGSANVLGEDFNVTSDIAQALGIPTGSGFVLSAIDAERFKGILNAYASQSKLNVLSTPRIIASNNQEAKIYVGKDVPIVTSETSSSTSAASDFDVRRTIQYKDTGVILDVKPYVNERSKIKLEINQTVSDAQTNKIGGSDSPIVNRREVKTTVFMDNKNTLLIGGMIKKNTNTAREGIPLLMDIPYLGKLFSSTSIIETNIELLILITPTIIDTPADAQGAIDDFEASMEDLFKEIRKREVLFWEEGNCPPGDGTGSETQSESSGSDGGDDSGQQGDSGAGDSGQHETGNDNDTDKSE